MIKERGKARILLVDDDERNLLALSEVLESIAEVVCASSGRDALRSCCTEEFAVILLDVFMPGIDGYETASLIRPRKQTAGIPIIFLSAVNKETEHLMRGYEMGAVDYVFEPVEPMIIKSKVGVFVDLYEARLQVETKSRAEQKLRDENYRAEIERLRIVRELEQSRGAAGRDPRALPIAMYEVDADADGKCCAVSWRRPQAVTGDAKSCSAAIASGEEGSTPTTANACHGSTRAPKRSGHYRWTGPRERRRHFLDQWRVANGTNCAGSWAGTLLDIPSAEEAGGSGWSTQASWKRSASSPAASRTTSTICSPRCSGGSSPRTPPDDGRARAARRRPDAPRRDAGRRAGPAHDGLRPPAGIEPNSVDPGNLCNSVAGLVNHTLGGTIRSTGNAREDEQPVRRQVAARAGADQPHPQCARCHARRRQRHVAISETSEADVAEAPMLPSGNYLRIRVTDKGNGIAESEIDKITEPFYTTKEAGKGTGLGLSMVSASLSNRAGGC